MGSRRFALPPITEAAYEPRGIPNARRDMEGTVLVRPEREEFMAMLGEMVQMVNEAVRRRASTVRDASKPLSLEYMGDRFDIDDPLVGYLAVTKDEGWLQGFVTCTCFTTWHRNFRWDSTNPSLDLLHAHPSAGGDASPAERKAPPAVDADGSLACELQAELHGGDPDGEGIVWPRIAELSLLGALGCGRWLVELIIGELEASGDYSYIVTQATDGSIPFYERMGFVRVGAVTLAPKSDAADGSAKRAGGSEGKGSSGKGSSGKGSLGGNGSGGKGSSGAKGSSSAKGGSPGKGSSGGDAKGVGGDGGGGSSSGGASSGKKRKAPAPPKRPQPVYSAYVEHRTEATGAVEETAEGLAGRYGVPVADLLFLNSARFPKLAASSVLRKDTKYLVPRPRTATEVEEEAKAMHSAWYVCKEEMPFKKVAEECAVEPREMLRLNAGRAELKGLMISSELIRGTRLLVKPEEYDVDEYCHWTFPDDDPSKAEPSYMMARRLQRKPAGSGADASSVLSVAAGREEACRAAEREARSVHPGDPGPKGGGGGGAEGVGGPGMACGRGGHYVQEEGRGTVD
jgi:hypothetical protein